MKLLLTDHPVEEEVEQAVLPGEILHTQVTLVSYHVFDHLPLLNVRDMRLTRDYRLQAHYLTVFDKVEDEAVVIEDGYGGSGVSLKLPHLSLINSVIQPIRLALQLPVLHYILVDGLLL